MSSQKWFVPFLLGLLCTGTALADDSPTSPESDSSDAQSEGTPAAAKGSPWSDREFIFGPTFGFSSSGYLCFSCTENSKFDATGRLGVHIGARMLLDHDPRIGLGATGEKWFGVNYQAVGGLVEGVDSGGIFDDDVDITVTSVEDQLVFNTGRRLLFMVEKKFSPYIGLGNYIGANVRYDVEVCEGKRNCESIDVTELEDEDLPPVVMFLFSRMAFGLDLEGGGRIEVKDHKCDVFVRYSVGSMRVAGGQMVYQSLTTMGAATYF